MKTLTGADVKAIIKKIFAMTTDEVNDYYTTISLADIDAKAKGYLFRACDERLARPDAMIEPSEVKWDEIR